MTTLDEKELATLILKRGQLKGQVTRFQNFINSFDENSSSIFEIETRFSRLDGILDKYEEVQHKIELLSGGIEQEDEREAFEDAYHKISAEAKTWLTVNNTAANTQSVNGVAGQSPNSNSPTTTQNNDSNTGSYCEAKLRHMDLPEFRGQYDEWIGFRDNFIALVHDNKKLSNVQKLYYLKTCLKGEAAKLTQALKMTNNNYESAWAALKKRFENKKRLVNTHVQAIFDLAPVKTESAVQLRQLLDDFMININTLELLGQSVYNWDTPMVCSLSAKLDPETKREWDRDTKKDEIETITITRLIDFLNERCQFLESSTEKKQKGTRFREEKTFTHISTSIICSFCKQNHFNNQCQNFLKMSLANKIAEVKKCNLCMNCLRPNHLVDDCRTRPCKHCNKKHHSLLHGNRESNRTGTSRDDSTTSFSQKQSSPVCSNKDDPCKGDNAEATYAAVNFTSNTNGVGETRVKNGSQVLLATAIVNILDADGKRVRCRALLDSGSQSHFMTRDLLIKLKLKSMEIKLPVAGVNNLLSHISHKTNTTIFSCDGKYKANESFLIIDKITGSLPQMAFDISDLELPENIQLADETFNQCNPIDILLGANLFFEILLSGQVRLGKNKPVAQKTKLGWIISGYLHAAKNNAQTIHCNLITSDQLHEQVQQFWTLEELNSKKCLSSEEMECEQHFVETFKRDLTGRFEVSLPLKDNFKSLGQSENIAENRFLALERRLQHNSELKVQYENFISEYEALGHMSLVTDSADGPLALKYYLPHHGIVKEQSTTTKLRVVFNASCATDSGIALNSVLKTGPTIQNDLWSIALKMRKHTVVCTGDIEKMYRQINVNPNQRDLQRILWRSNPKDSLKHYKLNTITYGTAPASFLACRCLLQLALENEINYPEACHAIKHDFYMDDFISGADDIQTALKLKSEVTQILKSAGFILRKWCSNRDELLDEQGVDDLPAYYISRDEKVKTLGLVWNPREDTFTYSVNLGSARETVTKRSILSVIAKIFDPLGLIGPVTVQAKLLLQNLWQAQISWDETIPDETYKVWKTFHDSLIRLNEIKIPRQVTVPNFTQVQMHGFSDASELSFGACIYVRTLDANGEYSIKLLCAKSKIAPIKKITLPRLELNGALLLARLANKIEAALDMPILEKFLWCDSTIVLNWLSAEPNNWNTYVANRVTEIQELSKNSVWKHIASNLNPADIISRGSSPDNLRNNQLWWSGPGFLKYEMTSWPETQTLDIADIPEKRKVKTIQLTFITYNGDFIFNQFSSFTKTHRVFTQVLRFLYNANPANEKKLYGDITVSELNKSLILLLKITQNQCFAEEIRCLQSTKGIPNASKLLPLNVFLDNDGLLRVGGRIKHANVEFGKKHQIVLPYHHPFTKMIIEYEHKRSLHAGQLAVLAAVRRKYWPINGKRIVRDILRRCIVCYKAKPLNSNPLMGDIPKSRLQPARPFSTVGVDYAGPILVKDGTLKSRKIVKTYICIFVCFITKAVHIELAGDLSSKTFLNCLKRFASRRGLCSSIYSDNGTNFVGANNELKSLIQTINNSSHSGELRSYLLENSISWHFTPPFSPHHGGLWEAAVRSAKYHLTRVIGNAHLTYESLYTVLCQIEAILNSRPLSPLSSDPQDLSVLTPAHFLVGAALTTVPQADVSEIPDNRLKLYERLQKLTQHFWRRWSNEYLTSLQPRGKWKKSRPGLCVGDLVLIQDDNLPVLQWRLGRVTTLHPGKDGTTRVVSVLVRGGEIKRSVVKLYKLPL